MKFLRLAVLSLTALATVNLSIAQAPIAEPSPEPVWTIAPSFVSKYLFRGVRLGGPCFQPSVDYTAGALSLGVWSSFALEDRVEGDSDPELDLYGSYTLSFSEDTWSLVPGFYVYTYPDADRSAGLYSVTVEPSLAAVFTAGGVQFTPKVYYDLMLKSPTAELTAALALPLKTLGTELDFVASVGTFKASDVTRDASPADKNWGDYWLFGVGVPVQVTMRSKVVVGFTYSEGKNNFYKSGSSPKQRNEDAGRHGAFSITYATTF